MSNIQRSSQTQQDKNRILGYSVVLGAGAGMGLGGTISTQRIANKLEEKLKSVDMSKPLKDNVSAQIVPEFRDSFTWGQRLRELKLNRFERGLFALSSKTSKELSQALTSGEKIQITDADIPKVIEALKHRTPFAQRALVSSLAYMGILGLGYGILIL